MLPVPDYGGDLLNRSRLTGDWGGTRTDLANKGVQVDVDWTQYVQGVVDGGIDRSTRYGGHLDYLVHLDLMRMGLIPGGLVKFRAEFALRRVGQRHLRADPARQHDRALPGHEPAR